MFRTGKELEAKLALPERTLDQWRYVGKGPRFVRVGRHVRYRDEDIDAWVAEHTVDPQPAA